MSQASPTNESVVTIGAPGSHDEPLDKNDGRLPDHLRQLLDESRRTGIDQSVALAGASNTQRAYEGDWNRYEEWCTAHGIAAFPASGEVVAAYFLESSNMIREDGSYHYAPSTMSRWIAGINHKHRVAGLPLPGVAPEVRGVLVHIRRARARPVRRKAPILASDLKEILAGIDIRSYPAGVIGRRDAAMLVLAFAGALRGADLAASTTADAVVRDDGLWLRLRSPQTHTELRGSFRGVAPGSHPETCPPCVFLHWTRLLVAGMDPSWPETAKELLGSASSQHICRVDAPHLRHLDPAAALFPPVDPGGRIAGQRMSPSALHNVVKRRAAAVGLDSSNFSSHSLRAGFITEAIAAGAQTHDIVEYVGYRHASSVDAYRSEKPATAWNPAALGL